MAKGKYAVRARNKADADTRWQNARTETDRLRTEVVRLRAYEQENATLRKALGEARSALSENVAPEVRKLTEDLNRAQAWKRRAEESYDRFVGNAIQAVLDGLEMAGVKPHSTQWWKALGPVVSATTKMGDDVPFQKKLKRGEPVEPFVRAEAIKSFREWLAR